ncbi:hypothetical protein, partial [Nesterenkonia sp.]|uniref:hypothetical protein n=1 Tax=Nesterenkonia sp. TaxID=704201 RepID=UPI00262F2227
FWRGGVSGHRSLFLGLVVPVGVDEVFGEDGSGGQVDDHGFAVMDQCEDALATVCSSDVEVAEFAGSPDLRWGQTTRR